ILFVLVLLARTTLGQSVAASNFNYWYDPTIEVELQIRPVRAADKIMVRYSLVARHGSPEKYTVKWEKRSSYVETSGIAVTEKDSVLSTDESTRRGYLVFEAPDKPWLLLGHV